VSARIGAGAGGAWATLRRGLALSPEMARGAGLTLGLAGVSTVGRVLVPITVQQTLDRGILGPGGPRPGLVFGMVAAAVVGLALTGAAAYAANRRIFAATEGGLSTLRTTAFRHIHDLSVLTQSSHRRGALVSRVTSDVDTITTFVQWGGLLLVLASGQLLVATALMAAYSWQLTVLVWACFLPLFLGARSLQRRVSRAYAAVRERVGDLLAAVSESVTGADTIRAYGVEERTQSRIDTAIETHRRAATRAQILVASTFSGGVLVSGVVVAAVVVAGTWLGACCSSSSCSPGRSRSARRCSTNCRTPSPAGGG
jgi:putative ABC transport system ATP-binding protein